MGRTARRWRFGLGRPLGGRRRRGFFGGRRGGRSRGRRFGFGDLRRCGGRKESAGGCSQAILRGLERSWSSVANMTVYEWSTISLSHAKKVKGSSTIFHSSSTIFHSTTCENVATLPALRPPSHPPDRKFHPQRTGKRRSGTHGYEYAQQVPRQRCFQYLRPPQRRRAARSRGSPG